MAFAFPHLLQIQCQHLLVALLIAMGILLWVTLRWYRASREPGRNTSHENEGEEKPGNPVISHESHVETQLQLQLKEQDLLYHALVLTELKQVQKSIGVRLSPFQFRFPKKKDQEEFTQLLSDILRDTGQEPMQNFELMFKQMHGGFYEKLVEKCAELSRSELQVCALLRLNLSSKDIARMTSLSVSTIDVTRHRIRKKFGLDGQTSLTTFLIQI